MWAAIYRYWASLPSRIAAGAVAVFGIFASLKPDKANALVARVMTPEQTYNWGVAGIIAVLTWLVVLLLLKSKAGEGISAAPGPTASTSGDGAPALSGNFRDVHFHGSPSPSAFQPPKSPWGSGQSPAAQQNAPQIGNGLGTSPELRRPTADLPFNYVLVRVYETLGGPPDDPHKQSQFYDKVDCTIADGVWLNRMAVWGRVGKKSINLIALPTLKNGWFDHKKASFFAPTDNVRPSQYIDLKFNKAQVDKVWPAPLKTTNEGSP